MVQGHAALGVPGVPLIAAERGEGAWDLVGSPGGFEREQVVPAFLLSTHVASSDRLPTLPPLTARPARPSTAPTAARTPRQRPSTWTWAIGATRTRQQKYGAAISFRSLTELLLTRPMLASSTALRCAWPLYIGILENPLKCPKNVQRHFWGGRQKNVKKIAYVFKMS